MDANGILVAGAGFTSESGYDYITPPGTMAPIPEPQNWALLLAGITLLGAWRNRVARAC